MEVGLRQLRAAVKGGKQPKARIGIAGAILWCIEIYPRGSTRAWWNQLMRFSEVQPLQLNVDGVRYDVYGTDADKDDGKLVEVLVAKDWKTDDRAKQLRFRAFQMYASQIKKKVRK